jgi:hypothetical protein
MEATTALACLEQDLDFCVRVLGNRNSLWSHDVVFPNPELPSRYRRLFRPDITARTIWRAVQAKRAVIGRCQENARASGPGKRKEFFENARWLILYIIFIRLHPERGDALQLAPAEIDGIRREADDVAEAIWTPAEPLGAHRHFKSVFCSFDDCRRLKGSAMATLAAGAAVPPGP